MREGSDYCPAHDPSRKEARRRAASKAARSKPHHPKGELADIKKRLRELAEGVCDGSFERADAAVASQIYNVILKALKLELDVREHTELLERLEELERLVEERSETPRYAPRWPSVTG